MIKCLFQRETDVRRRIRSAFPSLEHFLRFKVLYNFAFSSIASNFRKPALLKLDFRFATKCTS